MSTTDSEPPDPRLGLTIAERFRIDALIGVGGMARVYRARQLSLGEDVAVKFLSRAYSYEPELRARFRREAVVLARLRHPGIVTVIDFGEHDGELFIVMELIHGVPLADLLDPGVEAISIVRLGPLIDQLLAVLEAAHAEGVVHRDIKPGNIMLVETRDRGERIKLLDFGLAHVAGDGPKLTQTGAVQGTPAYMSPEQCRGVGVTPATDVYAVGVVLYEALAGDVPFEAEFGGAVAMAAHMFMDPPPMSEAAGRQVSAGIEDVVRRALAKKPEDRPTANEMRAELAAAMRGTDPITIAERASADRRHGGALSRSERALTSPRAAPLPKSERNGAVVAVWSNDVDRARELRDGLGLQGVTARVLAGLPSADLGGQFAAIVCRSDVRVDGLTAARALLPSVPFCVVDVEPDGIVPWIRAGASDVVVSGATDADLRRKVERILKRGR